MANEPLPLKRNRYAYPPSQECRITGSNLNRDFDDYHLPHSRLALASLQDWGVAQGLEVTGIIGSTEITVNSGAAIDGQGQLIWLASNGSGTLDINPPTKVPVPVQVDISKYQRTEDIAYYLTITFFEWEQREVGRPCDRVLEQVPWIRLQPISGDGAYVDDGTSVILGQVVIDAQGKLKELKTDGRRLVGKTVEQLQFRRADKAADQIQQVSAAKIKPAANGGLQITVPDANDKVLLEKEGGGNFTQLEVHTDTLDVAGNIKASELQGTRLQLSVDGAIAGSLSIQNDLSVSRNADIRGNLKISGNLEVQGNVIARDTQHIAGNVSLGDADNDEVKITGVVRSGHSSGALRVDNALHTTGSLTVDGNVGIGTTAPQAKLHISSNTHVLSRIEAGNTGGWAEIDLYSTYNVADRKKWNMAARGSGGFAIRQLTDSRGELAIPFFINTDGNVGIGTTTPGAKLHVINESQDANGNTLILGSTEESNLRLGYHTDYSWIQSHGSKPIAINPLGNNVGIGTTTPQGFQIVLPERNKTLSPTAGVTIAGGVDGNASIELRNNGTGTPYIDFAQAPTTDYNARIILTEPGKLEIQGAKLIANGAVVTGMIVMWSGQETNIPSGWALCNGQNGTPDLRSRFIVGAGQGVNPAYSSGQFGEPDQHAHTIDIPAQNFTTNRTGEHTHSYPFWYKRDLYTYAAVSNGSYSVIDCYGREVRNEHTSNEGRHDHLVTVDYSPFNSGSSSGYNRPKWYALCFIMKL